MKQPQQLPGFSGLFCAFALVLGATILTRSKPLLPAQRSSAKTQQVSLSAEHDFDFLVGSWAVQHRRLKRRLAHSNEWETFPGTCKTWLELNGQGNVDDNVLQLPTGTYRAITMRSFDPAMKSWSIWWLDSRHSHELDPPVLGDFRGGKGTFFAKDTFDGRPILVRFVWSDITPNSAKWQQAFSDDGGKTWETNWRMEFHRLAPAAANGFERRVTGSWKRLRYRARSRASGDSLVARWGKQIVTRLY